MNVSIILRLTNTHHNLEWIGSPISKEEVHAYNQPPSVLIGQQDIREGPDSEGVENVPLEP